MTGRQNARRSGEPTRAVGYVRVSTERQAGEGISLDAQRARLGAYAGLYDIDLVHVCEDAGLSAKSLNRPGLQEALGMLESGQANAVLVVKLDRLTRSVRDLGYLVEQYFAGGHWALLSVGEHVDTRTAGGRLVLNVLASVAQWEREAISERICDAKGHAREMGMYAGGRVPYGWRRGEGGMIVLNEVEMDMAAQANALRLAGMSLRTIGAELLARGLRPRGGGKWHPKTVKRVLAAQRPCAECINIAQDKL